MDFSKYATLPPEREVSFSINFDKTSWRFRLGHDHAHRKHEDAIEQVCTVE